MFDTTSNGRRARRGGARRIALLVISLAWIFGVASVAGAEDGDERDGDPAKAKSVSLTAAPTALDRAAASITEEMLQDLVNVIASDEMNGRYYLSEDGHAAARYVAKELESAGLEGLGEEGGFFQPIGVEKASPNVVAIRRGSGDRHLLLTAHYDHLRPKTSGKDRIFNGADDNACGVAALIAIARAFAKIEESPSASIVFIAFTGEEYGLKGSKYYVDNPLLPLESAIAIVNADMISRGEPDLLFVEGGRQFPHLAEAFRRGNEREGIRLDLHFDEHPRWLYMSDQMPFVVRRVPSIYLGVDFHPDTHRVTDEADRILPGLAARTARLMLATAFEIIADDEKRVERETPDGVKPEVKTRRKM